MRITIIPDERIATIRPEVYGHFAEHLGRCIYEGVWVGEDSKIPNTRGIRNDVAAALKALHPAVLRWPGGCFADDYHWQDGIGPRDRRPRRINVHWNQEPEPNSFGTHEFIDFCRMIGAQPYMCGNVGSGTVRELRDWVEYCNWPCGADAIRPYGRGTRRVPSDEPRADAIRPYGRGTRRVPSGEPRADAIRPYGSTLADLRAANGAPEPFGVKYWGVGNENWGCGGNFSPEDYCTEFRRYAGYMFNLGNPLFLIACGPSGNDVEWTRRFFAKLKKDYWDFGRIHGFSAHYYCGTAGSATEYTSGQWYQLLRQAAQIEPLVIQQRAAMDTFDPARQIGLIVDEWGTWHPATPGKPCLWQQNTIRDALVAALTLDTFNRHADKVVMSNIAQTINVLQSMVLTDGPRIALTPTYHVYEMYRVHQGATAVRAIFEADKIQFGTGADVHHLFGLDGSASMQDATLTVSVVNPSVDTPAETAIRILGAGKFKLLSARILTADDIHAHNRIGEEPHVQPRQEKLKGQGTEFTYAFAPASVTVLRMEAV